MKLALAIALILAVAGGVYMLRRQSVRASSTPARPVLDYVVRVSVVPVWMGPGPMPTAWGTIPAFRGAKQDIRFSAIQAKYPEAHFDEQGKHVLIPRHARGGSGEGHPIIRREVRRGPLGGYLTSEKLTISSGGSGIGEALGVAVVIASIVVSAVGSPAAGAAVAAGGSAVVAAAS